MGHDNDQYRGDGQWDAHGAFDPSTDADPTPTPAFDGYDLHDVPLGDLLRGERATLGKSLLDVERELRIRATYIAAIENGDVGAFQSPGFIAGYVRSYARYLGIDPEWTFRRFCEGTGFRGIHGGAAGQAGEVKRKVSEAPRRLDPNEVMSSTRISYAPVKDSFFARVEPGALGSVAVLVLLACGIGYGAWAILHDIQRLNIAPIDEAPAVPLAQLDPLAGASEGAFDVAQGFDIAVPGPESADRLYRPQALEAPVLTPRDGAIGTVDPNEVGALADAAPRVAPQLGGGDAAAPTVQVTQALDQVMIYATNGTWVRVTNQAGDFIHEATLNRGDYYVIPTDQGTPVLRTGNAGSLYFAVNGVAFGPAGNSGAIVRDVELTAEALTRDFTIVDTTDPVVIEVTSTVIDTIPDLPTPVPTPTPDAVVYDPTGANSGQLETALTLFPDIPADQAAAIVASNALPVVVLTPDADTERPLPRP
ncbi:helix-turn-helix domain-containing protein [Gymnodinialimonas sp. 202GB13-11]